MTDDDWLADDNAAWGSAPMTAIFVPTHLVAAVRSLIAADSADADAPPLEATPPQTGPDVAIKSKRVARARAG